MNKPNSTAPERPKIRTLNEMLLDPEIAAGVAREERILDLEAKLMKQAAKMGVLQFRAETAEAELAQLRATNHRLSRERDALFRRKIVDSHAKVWLPYWRACRRWITDLQKQIAQLQAQIDR